MKEINYTEVHKKIINRIMLDGKKRKAEGIFDNSWFSIESKKTVVAIFSSTLIVTFLLTLT